MPASLRSPAFLAVLLFAMAACSPPGQASYVDALTAARAAKDDTLRVSATSPIPADRRSALLPLQYFAPDESYRVPAALQPDRARTGEIEVPTSTGQKRRMTVMGVLALTVHGRQVKLTAFAEEGSNGSRLFVPFTDATSGRETYGGGRYVDLDRTSAGVYIFDFNTAYNPYCAYNSTYDCPVPPPENRIAMAIRAGEKLPKAH